MTPHQRRDEWLRYWSSCLTPESRLGALRGALRDNVLADVMHGLKIVTPEQLVERLIADQEESNQ